MEGGKKKGTKIYIFIVLYMTSKALHNAGANFFFVALSAGSEPLIMISTENSAALIGWGRIFMSDVYISCTPRHKEPVKCCLSNLQTAQRV